MATILARITVRPGSERDFEAVTRDPRAFTGPPITFGLRVRAGRA
jgi:hypothetical protein